MKKLLTLTAVGAILTTPATAVQKCVALTPGITGNPTLTNSNQSEWAVNFPNLISRGIAILSDNQPSSTYESKSSLSLGVNGDNYYYCWCRLISPVVSNWVYSGNSTEGDYYVSGDLCASYCAYNIANDTKFQEVIFRSMFD